jgi:hypothetical protein
MPVTNTFAGSGCSVAAMCQTTRKSGHFCCNGCCVSDQVTTALGAVAITLIVRYMVQVDSAEQYTTSFQPELPSTCSWVTLSFVLATVALLDSEYLCFPQHHWCPGVCTTSTGPGAIVSLHSHFGLSTQYTWRAPASVRQTRIVTKECV